MLAVEVPDEVVVERPKNREHGDYATNIALRLAKPAGRPPREVADAVAAELRAQPRASPRRRRRARLPQHHPRAGRARASSPSTRSTAGDGLRPLRRRWPVSASTWSSSPPTRPGRCTSAAPAGPRWATRSAGCSRPAAPTSPGSTTSTTPASQIDRFAPSLQAAANGQPTPEDGYGGAYIGEIAAQVVAADPGLLTGPTTSSCAVFRSEGVELMFAEIRRLAGRLRRPLRRLLLRDGPARVRRAGEGGLARLREEGHVYDADGAVWLRTTDFGDDKDRVLVKADGEPTYFAADCAYYLDKRQRGFDKVVIMLGADHPGTSAGYKALAAASATTPT